jgi:hypothetical protein
MMLYVMGCRTDPDLAWRERTEKQLPEIRSGEVHTLFMPHPGMLRELARDKQIAANLEKVLIWGDASSGDFAALADFPKLTSVVVYDTKGTDAFLKHVLACEKIAKLSIDQTDLSDDGLATISRMESLEDLGVNSWSDRLSADGLNQLGTLKNLKTLRLRVGPSEPDLKALRSALPNCSIELEVEK